jgi:hypothetical protein
MPESREQTPFLDALLLGLSPISASGYLTMRRTYMTGCTKKISRRTKEDSHPTGVRRFFDDAELVDCDEVADAAEVGPGIAALVCAAHHVELVEALRPLVRKHRRLTTNVNALVAGYASKDIDIGDIEEVLDALEAVEDEIHEYVATWMGTTPKREETK